MRIGNYEFHPANQWCYQMYKVMPEGWDGKKKTKTASDGRRLLTIDCYPNDLGAAIRRAKVLAEKEAAR